MCLACLPVPVSGRKKPAAAFCLPTSHYLSPTCLARPSCGQVLCMAEGISALCSFPPLLRCALPTIAPGFFMQQQHPLPIGWRGAISSSHCLLPSVLGHWRAVWDVLPWAWRAWADAFERTGRGTPYVATRLPATHLPRDCSAAAARDETGCCAAGAYLPHPLSCIFPPLCIFLSVFSSRLLSLFFLACLCVGEDVCGVRRSRMHAEHLPCVLRCL